MEGLNQFREDKFIIVTDNWYPCYEGNKVKLSIFLSFNKNLNYHFVRICAWGEDDFGLEMDYEDENYENLVAKYHEWKENIFDKIPKGINQEWFFEHGFYPA